MNRVLLMGRLAKDPDVRYTTSGKCVVQFTVAVDRPFANQNGEREADFIPVVMWGKRGETVGNSFSKGQKILVEGRWQVRTYDDKDGNKRWVNECVAENFEFVEAKRDAAAKPAANAQAGNGSGAAAPPSPMDGMGQELPFDEQIPF